MTLVAKIRAFAVHHVAIDAFERVAVVGRNVRVRGLDVLRLFHEGFDLMAARAGFHRGFGGRRLTGVAGFAFEAELGVAVGEVFGGVGRGNREESGDERGEDRGLFHDEGFWRTGLETKRAARSGLRTAREGESRLRIRPSWRILHRRSCRR